MYVPQYFSYSWYSLVTYNSLVVERHAGCKCATDKLFWPSCVCMCHTSLHTILECKADDLDDMLPSMLQTAAACDCQDYNNANVTG